jgi:hypothetical protein
VKERPILMSGAMVRALLDGSKTQTRRLCKPMNLWVVQDCREVRMIDGKPFHFLKGATSPMEELRSPYGQPGDRLYVRETFLYVGPGSGSDLPSYREERANPENHKASNCWFRASQPDETLVWTPSIHMPRWASRITLEVTGVRIERLQDISAQDAWAEGIPHSPDVDPGHEYQELWDSLNAVRGYGWDANPWVWVVEFRKIDVREANQKQAG